MNENLAYEVVKKGVPDMKKIFSYLTFLFLFSGSIYCQQFPCDGKLYFFGNDGTSNYISYIDGYTTPSPIVNNLVALPPTFGQNALSANPKDGYLYFIDAATYDLYQVDANGNYTLKCDSLVNSNKGCFDHLGRFWVIDYLNNMLAFDINTCDTVKGPFPIPVINGVDIVFSAADCHFYMGDENQVNKIDTNGVIVASYTPGFNAGTGYGGLAIGHDGNLYGVPNNVTPGELYMFNLTTNSPGGKVFTFPSGSTATPCGCDMASFPCPILRSAFAEYSTSCGVPRSFQFTSTSVGLINSWVWDFGDGTVDSVNQNPAHTYTAAGTYSVSLIIHAYSKCLYIAPDTMTMLVTVNPSLSAAPSSGNVTCNGLNNGWANVTAGGGSPPYGYSWSNGATTSAISNLAPGSYTVTLSDSSYVPNGVELVANGNFSLGDSLFTSGYQYCNTANCLFAEGFYTVAPNPPFYHSLFVGADHTSGAGNFMIINGDSTGQTVWSQSVTGVLPNTNYTFSVWVCSVHPVSPAQLQFSINGVPIGFVFGAPPFTGLWQQFYVIWNSGSNTSATISILNLNPNQQGNDFGLDDISFQAVSLCYASASVTITEPTTLTVSSSQTNLLCNGDSSGSATITPAGGTPGYTYTWNNGASTSSATGLAAGTYSVVVSDANACTVAVNTYSLTQPAVLSTSVSATSILCNGGTSVASVNPSGGTQNYSYSWSSGASTSSASALIAGNYTVTVTDANGCSRIDSINISQPSALTSAIASTTIACNGGTSTASVIPGGGTPGYSYSWSSGASTSSATALAGNYSVTITDVNGCTTTNSITITEPTTLTSSTSQTNILCNGPTGSATVTATGGTPGYSYNWNSGQSTSAATGLSSGSHSVTVTDANGCTSTSILSISQPAPLVLSASCNDSICLGDSTALSVIANGGTPNYTYTWLPGPMTGPSVSVNPTSSTVYAVTVTDANGCTSSASTCSVTVLPIPNAMFDTLSSGMYASTYSFTDSSTGATSWYWIFGDGTTSSLQNPIHTFPGAGTYTVTEIAYNQFGCPDTFKIVLDFEDGILIPNVFTPDGDGINDVWYIPNSGMKEFHVTIFDRWGLKVFETTADEIRWDGHSSAGKLLSDGTYYYVLTAILKSFNGDKDYSTKGYVTLLTQKRKQ